MEILYKTFPTEQLNGELLHTTSVLATAVRECGLVVEILYFNAVLIAHALSTQTRSLRQAAL